MLIAITGPPKWNSLVKRLKDNEEEECYEKIRLLLGTLQTMEVIKGRELILISSLHAGLDLQTALIAINLGIPIEAIIACDDQDETYSEKARSNFQFAKEKCRKLTKVVEGIHTPGCIKKQMELLNKRLQAEEASIIAVITRSGLGKRQSERIKNAKNALIHQILLTKDPRV